MKNPKAVVSNKCVKSSFTGSQYMATMTVNSGEGDGIDDVIVIVKGYDSMPSALCRNIAKKMGWKLGK